MKKVAIGFLGLKLDRAVTAARRFGRWRPTVDLFRHDDIEFDRLDLLFDPQHTRLATQVSRDVEESSPETNVVHHRLTMYDPWDFEEVYGQLHDFARNYPFDPENEEYFVHITTGTHVAQICLFLLTESRHLPARLLQTSPAKRGQSPGRYSIIDLDLSRYDRLAARFEEEHRESRDLLKSGIDTKSPAFNQLIERIEQISVASTAPILLTGPTGAGKSALARRIYELRHARRLVEGPLVEVNCATLRGDQAMSALFGHTSGAFTGASKARTGLLKRADGGMLFLDEIGELGLDEQAMLLRALEEKRFLPVGSDQETESDFQLLAGTNKDLASAIEAGTFREDLLARIHLWTFPLPALRDRREDLEPNLDYELGRFREAHGKRVAMNREARDAFLRFATDPTTLWNRNFRDLNAAVTRMATLATGGRIGIPQVKEEIARLKASWASHDLTSGSGSPGSSGSELANMIDLSDLDRFDRIQLQDVAEVCSQSRTLSEAGRTLFAASRAKKKSSNDADRLRKYLARFDLTFDDFADDFAKPREPSP